MAGKKEDRRFVECLKAVQRHYVHFPKATRLRIEAWVQKIAAGAMSNGNDCFALHRHRYASLLMHQCMKRTLSDPFDKPPPDGLLPAFPTHLRSKLRDVVDPEDAMFWSDIFDALQNAQEAADGNGDEAAAEARSSKSRLDQGNRSADASSQQEGVGDDDVQRLRHTIQTQEHRIAMLVKQMESDRAAFQLALQRQEQKYKAQLSRLENTLKEIGRMSVTAKSIPDPLSARNDNDLEQSLLFAPLPKSSRAGSSRYADPMELPAGGILRPKPASTPNITRSMTDDEFLRYLNQFQQNLQTESSGDLLL